MRIVLLLTSLLLGIGASAQAVFEVKSPESIKGFYTFSLSDSTTHYWGNGSMAKKSVTAELKLATGADSLAGNTLVGDYTGKIAVIHRGGGVAFVTKALNAQKAGAVGCIILNHGIQTDNSVDLDETFNMESRLQGETGTNASGLQVKIPLIFISKRNAALISERLRAETVIGYLGGKQKLDYDLSIDPAQLILPTKRTRPTLLATEGLVSDSLGIKIFNKGAKENTMILVTARITFKGNEIYADTFSIASIKPDTSAGFYAFDVFKPAFDLEKGEYTLSYKVGNFGQTTVDTLVDQYPVDNTFSMNFYVTDSIFALGRIESYAGSNGKSHVDVPAWRYTTRPGGTYKDYSSCLVFNEPGANKVQAEGIKFLAYAFKTNASPAVVLKGNKFKVSVLEWNDPFESILDSVTYDNIAPLIDNQEVDVTDSLVWDYVYAKFDNPVPFEEGKRYLFCATTSNQDIRFGYDTEAPSFGASVLVANLQPLVPIKIDSKYYYMGFSDSAEVYGNSYIPAISIEIGKNTVSVEEKSILESSFNVYPNPASSVVNVSFKLENNSNVNVTVSDLTGKVVYTNKVNKTAGSNSFAIDTKGLNSGMYVVSVTTENGVATRRVSIEK